MSRVAGHAIQERGAAFNYDGNGIRVRGLATGPARCECGAESPHLWSTNARKRWHRDHKETIKTEGAT